MIFPFKTFILRRSAARNTRSRGRSGARIAQKSIRVRNSE
jgi:hypothetical protein